MSYCEACRNTGIVTIYDPAIVYSILTGHEGQTITLHDGPRSVTHRIRNGNGNIVPSQCDVPCSCRLGDPSASWTNRDGSTRHVRRFTDSRLFVRVLEMRGEYVEAQAWSEEIEKHVLSIAQRDPEDNRFNTALDEVA